MRFGTLCTGQLIVPLGFSTFHRPAFSRTTKVAFATSCPQVEVVLPELKFATA